MIPHVYFLLFSCLSSAHDTHHANVNESKHITYYYDYYYDYYTGFVPKLDVGSRDFPVSPLIHSIHSIHLNIHGTP